MKIPLTKKWIVWEVEDYATYMFITATWEGFTIINTKFGFENCRWLSAEYIDGRCVLFSPLDEYRYRSKQYLATIFTRPKLWDKLHRENIYYAAQTIKLGNKLKKLKLEKLSGREILSWVRKINKLQLENHDRRGIMFTIEVKDNLFSNYLNEYLAERCQDLGSKISALRAFQVLTTPTRKSLIKKQQEDLLKIALIKNKAARDMALECHAKKYEWLEYGLQGKILDLDHFKKELGLARRRNPKKLLRQSEAEIGAIKKSQNEIIKKLQIHGNHRKLFQIARDSIFVKVLSKDAQFYCYYAAEGIFREICRRGGLTLEQLRFLTYEEYEKILAGKDYSALANQRKKYSLHFSDRGQTLIYAGAAARKIRKKLKFAEEELTEFNHAELKGSPAYPGKVSGKVKIVNSTQEMMKMHASDIMVSHATNPDIVPAMKMAGAIVTDLGGITCHAAIVSRELKKPCVIGTKYATKVLKDGDKVEVDADKGIIKKL